MIQGYYPGLHRKILSQKIKTNKNDSQRSQVSETGQTKAWSSHRHTVLNIFAIVSKLCEMEIFLVLKHSLHL